MIVILGCGYTGRRVARLLASAGHEVLATRHRAELMLDGVATAPLDVTDPALVDALSRKIPESARVLHSVPLMRDGDGVMSRPSPLLAPVLERASRVVYLSTTGVYGDQRDVDENTGPAPRGAREQMRLEEERDVAAACPASLILRPAAIYGPGRGVHVALRQGRHKLWGDGSNFISRIHVDDLAVIAAAALVAGLTGAYPVADEEACPAMEITRYCAGLLGIDPPAPTGGLAPEDTRSANRRVDGRAIRRLLHVGDLRYPSYRTGIPAAIKAGMSDSPER